MSYFASLNKENTWAGIIYILQRSWKQIEIFLLDDSIDRNLFSQKNYCQPYSCYPGCCLKLEVMGRTALEILAIILL